MLLDETFDDAGNLAEWQPLPRGASVDQGFLRVVAGENAGENVSVTSVPTFTYSTVEARIRVSEPVTNRFYLGFFSREPWASESCWLMIEGDRFKFQARRENGPVEESSSWPVDAGEDGWHTVKIEWGEKQIAFFWDGQPCGSITNPASISSLPLPVVVDGGDINGQPSQVEVDWIKVSGGERR